MSSERESQRQAFLKSAGLASARREPLSGDASTRAYERLYPVGGGSLIFMDQPPSVETEPCPPDADPAERARLGYNALARLAAGRVDAFVACAGYLRGLGLSAPKVEFADPARGLAVLEDLGDDLFARLIEAGQDEAPLYDAAIDALARLHEQRPPHELTADGSTWPLLSYDAVALRTGADLLVEWLPQFDRRVVISPDIARAWRDLTEPIIERGAAGASVFCHRDYHAENLLWLPRRDGVARVGLIDFQDAVRAHPAWDLSMLLHDARREVSPERETACLNRYLASRPDLDRETFLADYHGLGAINVARILGIFARLVFRDGKPRYRAFMPRLWRYLDRCLIDPAPQGLADWLTRAIPLEARS